MVKLDRQQGCLVAYWQRHENEASLGVFDGRHLPTEEGVAHPAWDHGVLRLSPCELGHPLLPGLPIPRLPRPLESA